MKTCLYSFITISSRHGVDVVEEHTEEVQHDGDSEYGKNEAQGELSKGLLAVYERRMPHTFW